MSNQMYHVCVNCMYIRKTMRRRPKGYISGFIRLSGLTFSCVFRSLLNLSAEYSFLRNDMQMQ